MEGKEEEEGEEELSSTPALTPLALFVGVAGGKEGVAARESNPNTTVVLLTPPPM